MIRSATAAAAATTKRGKKTNASLSNTFVILGSLQPLLL